MTRGWSTCADFASSASYAHYLKSRLLHHEGDAHKAVDELRLALASDDGNPFLLTALAEEYARSSDLSRAEVELKKVISLHPRYQPAQLLLGRVLYEGRKFSRAPPDSPIDAAAKATDTESPRAFASPGTNSASGAHVSRHRRAGTLLPLLPALPGHAAAREVRRAGVQRRVHPARRDPRPARRLRSAPSGAK